jgi:copper chaperone CopZ
MKKNTFGWMVVAVLLALGAGCFRNTVSEIELKIPAMRSEGCAQQVQATVARLGLGPEEAIREIRIDVNARTAWVKYDNVRLGRRNIEVAVRNSGFAVNDLPANEEARAKLPPECRGDE